MKFTDGGWETRPGVDAQYAQQVYDLAVEDDRLVAWALTHPATGRGCTINRTLFTVTLSSPAEGVIGVRVEHHQGGPRDPGFSIRADEGRSTQFHIDAEGGTVDTGSLKAHIRRDSGWELVFEQDGRACTSSGRKSVGLMRLSPGAPVTAEPAGVAGVTTTGLAASGTYTHVQLSLGVGELVFGLGERFGPLVKNGQRVDVWNADGGTSSEQAYKNVPFYMTNRGYGVLVNHAGHVSFEVGSEAVGQVQFSVAGEILEYFVIAGPTPAAVLDRYTRLTGRPARVPEWSYGLWLTSSAMTDYDEATVTSFIQGMTERDIPLGVFHFDCFWMRETHLVDFVWDPDIFPDPAGMLRRLHDLGVRVSVWLNPYIAQRSRLFREGVENGYLVRRPDGSVWQCDLWHPGMTLVDFTNPRATQWFKDYVRGVLELGVDAIKTDFGERVPIDVVWHDGSAAEAMHQRYTDLYNRAVFEVLEEVRGPGEAVVFARSATVGGQSMPVHWGGDPWSSFESMAETLRGGLSLAFSGFAYWSHDIGGFEGNPDAAVFKRWLAFGLLSSHSRLHGSTSYRVPWAFDDGTEAPGQSAVEVARRFAKMKRRLTPYLVAAGEEAHQTGRPIMRPMQMEFPEDPAVAYLDRQYMLGPSLLVAPVFSAVGDVEYYLPRGRWTNWFTGELIDGGNWHHETHGFDTLPLWVREGATLPMRDEERSAASGNSAT